MELRPGYKKTEVGVVPEGWSVKTLGQLATVVRGGSPRPAGDPRYFDGDFIPWLTVAALTNIPDYELRVSETVGCLTEDGSKQSRTLQEGTLIIANSGATLGVAKILGVTCCANDGIAALINQQEGIKPFLCYYLNTQTKRLREVVATGNGQPNLNTTLIRHVSVPFPCDDEQRSIAGVLGDVDALLGALEKLIAKKRDLKQAAMQQLLTGKKRLPGFNGEWVVRALGDGITLLSGHHVLAQHCNRRGHGVPYLTGPADFPNGKIQHTKFTLQPTTLCAPSDILVTVKGSGSGSLVVADAVFCISRQLMAIRVRDWNGRFIYYSLLQNASQIKAASTGLIPGLSRSDIVNQFLPFPTDPAEQTAIAAVLSDMDEEIAALEQRLAKTRALKQGMMQELLTGRIRFV